MGYARRPMRNFVLSLLALCACNQSALPGDDSDGSIRSSDAGAIDLLRSPIDQTAPIDFPVVACPALQLDAYLAFAVAPEGGNYNPRGSLTLEAWALPLQYHGPVGHDQILIAHGGGAHYPLQYWLALDGQNRLTFTFVTNANGDVIAETGDVLPVNRWAHVAAAFTIGRGCGSVTPSHRTTGLSQKVVAAFSTSMRT